MTCRRSLRTIDRSDINLTPVVHSTRHFSTAKLQLECLKGLSSSGFPRFLPPLGGMIGQRHADCSKGHVGWLGLRLWGATGIPVYRRTAGRLPVRQNTKFIAFSRAFVFRCEEQFHALSNAGRDFDVTRGGE